MVDAAGHLAGLSAIEPSISGHLEIDAKYDVYLKRQTADVDAFRRDEGLVLTDIDYADVPGLSNERAPSWRRRDRGQWGRRVGSMVDTGGAGYPRGLSAPRGPPEDFEGECVNLFRETLM